MGRIGSTFQRHGDQAIAAALFIATLVSRIPFRSTKLYAHDSAGFALALENFDLRLEQPHPPGYILYIAIGRAFDSFVSDGNAALVWLSIVSSAVAVVAIYFVGKSIFGRSQGIIAAILLFFSPLFWHYGEVALTYSVGVPLSMLITWLLYQIFFNRRYAILCGLAMGLAAGVRQDLLIFFAPVFFIAGFRVGWRRMFISWGAVILGVLLWLVPLIMSAGTLSQFLEIQSRQYGGAVLPVSFFEKGAEALAINGKVILKALVWLMGPAIVMLVVSATRVFRRDWKTIFLLGSALPALGFFLLFFIDPLGYMLICTTAFILLAAQGIVLLSTRVTAYTGGLRLPLLEFPPIRQPVVAALLLLLSSWISFSLFLSGSWTLDRLLPTSSGYGSLFITENANGIRANSASMAAAIAAVNRYEPESTVVICNIADNVYNWNRLAYYLPEYRVIGLHLLDGVTDGSYQEAFGNGRWFRGGGVIELAPEVERIIFIGQEVDGDSYLDFSGNVVVQQDSLIRPDRFAPSVIAIVEPLADDVSLGPYVFTRAP